MERARSCTQTRIIRFHIGQRMRSAHLNIGQLRERVRQIEPKALSQLLRSIPSFTKGTIPMETTLEFALIRNGMNSAKPITTAIPRTGRATHLLLCSNSPVPAGMKAPRKVGMRALETVDSSGAETAATLSTERAKPKLPMQNRLRDRFDQLPWRPCIGPVRRGTGVTSATNRYPAWECLNKIRFARIITEHHPQMVDNAIQRMVVVDGFLIRPKQLLQFLPAYHRARALQQNGKQLSCLPGNSQIPPFLVKTSDAESNVKPKNLKQVRAYFKLACATVKQKYCPPRDSRPWVLTQTSKEARQCPRLNRLCCEHGIPDRKRSLVFYSNRFRAN